MKKLLWLLPVIGLIFALHHHHLAQATLPVLNDLTDIWNVIEPGGETICSQGEPYSFLVHPGNPQKLLIHFDGGGGCWNDETCGPRSGQLYTETVEVTANDLTTGYGGMFDLANPENPFADYSMVFIPYCTADMHMGDSVVTYGSDDQAVEIRHNGFVNAQTVLNWTYTNFAAPEQVFVTGVSAGGPGSIFHTPFIMEHYADIPVTHLGDSGGGWRGAEGKLTTMFTNWNTIALLPDTGSEGLTAETLSFEKLYSAAAARYPDQVFAQYNTAHDQTQNYFLGLMVLGVFYDSTLKANMADITASVPNFRYFTAGGSEHGILGGQNFYTYAVNGLRFRDWINDLANGIPVENVVCTTCYKAEEVGID